MRHRVALATYEHAPELAPDDRALVPALQRVGIDAEPLVWSDSTAPWSTFNAVVLRSCWDYHLHAGAFHAWLARLESIGVPVMNSPALVRWNADKRYLFDLAQRGVATMPTLIVSRDRPGDVALFASAEGWSRFVIKPAVSASGYETYALSLPLDSAAAASVARVTAVGDALLQPFAPEIPHDGEYSLTFIDGEFNHATIKRAAAGEFRVQTEHGGSVASVVVSRSVIQQAERVIAVLPERPLYARVDGIIRGDAFLLMELELIEPNLFLAHNVDAAGKLAAAIRARLLSSPRSASGERADPSVRSGWRH